MYDADASLKVERDRISPNLIDEFDKMILELRELADDEELDKKAIEKIIREGIEPLIRGERRNQ